MYVKPENVASEATTFVVYNPQEGEGHYDVALSFNDEMVFINGDCGRGISITNQN